MNLNHIDRDGLNNRKENLREVTNQAAVQHGSGDLRANITSGYMGVVFWRGKFNASVWDDYGTSTLVDSIPLKSGIGTGRLRAEELHRRSISEFP